MIRQVGESLGRSFWRLWTASASSNLADGLVKTALPLLAVATTRDPVLVAGVSTAATLPWLLLALPVGAWVDRHDRRRSMLGANVVRALAVAAAAVLVLAQPPAVWLLYLLAAALGCAEVVHDTAAQSVLPQVVGRDRLTEANGRLLAVELTANELVGPPLGGLLVAAGAALALGAPALLWLLALVALMLIRGRFRVARPSGGSVLRDVGTGVRFVLRHRVLVLVGVITGVFNLASNAASAVLVLFAVGPSSPMGLSEAGFGLLVTTTALGSVAGTFVAPAVERRFGPAATMALGLVLGTAFVGGPALTTDPWLLGTLFAVSGVGLMLWNVVAVSARQRVTPDDLLGRTTGVHRLVAWGTRPLGALLGGAVASVAGLGTVFVGCAVLVLVSTPLLLLLRGGDDFVAVRGSDTHDPA